MSGIELVTGEPVLLDAAVDDRDELARRLQADVAEGWDVFPAALPRAKGGRWGSRFFVLDEPRTLVGWGGFKGPPDEDGVVELGYAISPAYEGRGLATAATRAMVEEAFADEAVTSIIAHTLAEPNASVRVLEKSGFVRDGTAGDGTWRHRLDRA